MSFIEMALDEVKESQPVPEGTYDLRVKSADIVDSKKPGAQNIRVILEIEGEANADNIFLYLSLPNPSDDEKVKNFKILQIKRFLHWFNIPSDGTGLNIADFAGSIASLPVLVDEYEGRISNKVDLQRIPNER